MNTAPDRNIAGEASMEREQAYLERYRQQLLSTSAYEKETQLRLKRRVFDTFDQFLQHIGRPGLTPGTQLLDLGAADGLFVECCNEAGLRASGIDINDGINLEDTPFPNEDSSVDVVTANSVLEHLMSPANMLGETMRCLRPGGALVIVTPNWRYSVRSFYEDPTHVRPYTPTSVTELLGMYGFENIRVVPWIVKKPAAMWDMPLAFQIARFLPFRGDAPGWIPGFLKGRSTIMLVGATKS